MKNKIINKLQALWYVIIQMDESDYGFDEWEHISYQNAPNFDFLTLKIQTKNLLKTEYLNLVAK